VDVERDRKMLTCFQAPGGADAGSASPAMSTRPSAGETTHRLAGDGPIGVAEEIHHEERDGAEQGGQPGQKRGKDQAGPSARARTATRPDRSS